MADFGIAKDLAGITDNKTAAEAVMGSLDYISPEQARSELVPRCTDVYYVDIHRLGIIAVGDDGQASAVVEPGSQPVVIFADGCEAINPVPSGRTR